MLTQACLERTKTSFHFAFPIAKSWGFLSSFLFWKTVPLSTWDSPFLSVCIVLYFPIIVNAFLSNFYEFIWCCSPKIRPAQGRKRRFPHRRARYAWGFHPQTAGTLRWGAAPANTAAQGRRPSWEPPTPSMFAAGNRRRHPHSGPRKSGGTVALAEACPLGRKPSAPPGALLPTFPTREK